MYLTIKLQAEAERETGHRFQASYYKQNRFIAGLYAGSRPALRGDPP